MQTLPFNIPRSLSSYVEKFEENPKKTISKLQKHVKKRDPDAVGHFLLAWFYHIQDQNSNAIKEALIAKTYAPGSPLMEHLHYFMVHPELFEASIPSAQYNSEKKLLQANRTSPILDLDRLIEMLEAVESQRIQISMDGEADETDLSEESTEVEDIISETLAKIHVTQGNKKEAIKMYERLITINEDKADTYSTEISKLKEN
ncbi:MAG: tetratricopeptide repeat protein [Balneolaceae bacterium]